MDYIQLLYKWLYKIVHAAVLRMKFRYNNICLCTNLSVIKRLYIYKPKRTDKQIKDREGERYENEILYVFKSNLNKIFYLHIKKIEKNIW